MGGRKYLQEGNPCGQCAGRTEVDDVVCAWHSVVGLAHNFTAGIWYLLSIHIVHTLGSGNDTKGHKSSSGIGGASTVSKK